ncbi:MAG: transcription termination/antitermination protein NusA [Candidatus Omnitrophica bacterium]|nr:transcription termination/antitermination protein NusA [Candidatus Omnitrophota bacterium]
MNGELLAVLDHIERDKGISRKVLIEAVEAALVSAARKTIGGEETDEFVVTLDGISGQIEVFINGEKYETPDFGRIAAQTAKQVIIQKIREAERDVVFVEYQAKVGELVNGIIHRFERGDLIVDLGRTEAVLPRREQSPREEYRQGERLRAYVLDVRRNTKGQQIILSRTHPGLIQELFELEVPEIYDGIVEIKSIAREPGERSKVSVFSNDDKVDSVGACVGMRGTRVKSIVRELQGEKVDIVRWSDEIRSYIAAALNPAEIDRMDVDLERKHSEIIVEDSQLSLAIGKRGQNVRLASKLTGWTIDIRSESAAEALRGLALSQLPSVGAKTEEALRDAGYLNVDMIARASVEALTQVPGVGEKGAEKMIESAKELVQDTLSKVTRVMPSFGIRDADDEEGSGEESSRPARRVRGPALSAAEKLFGSDEEEVSAEEEESPEAEPVQEAEPIQDSEDLEDIEEVEEDKQGA